jgi:hypothetical protein
MDSLIYFFFSAITLIGVFGGIFYFKKDESLDSILFPVMSLFSSLILIFVSYSAHLAATPILSEMESKLMIAFWIGMMLISFVEIVAIATSTFGNVIKR